MSRTAILAFFALLFAGAAANAEVVITVNKSSQRLSVDVDGQQHYEWPVSTARWGYNTPNGVYRPERLEKTWYSRKYDMSPMPHSIFFDGGYAIHGSYEVSRLGRPASHGCIRLSPANAAILFALVQNRRHDTRIVVTGHGPLPVVRARPNNEFARDRYYRQQAESGVIFNGGPRWQNGWAQQSGGYWWRN